MTLFGTLTLPLPSSANCCVQKCGCLEALRYDNKTENSTKQQQIIIHVATATPSYFPRDMGVCITSV